YYHICVLLNPLTIPTRRSSDLMRRRPLIGPVQLTRFIRQRLTVFLLTLFTMLGGYSGRKVRLHRRSRSTQQTSAHPRRRAVGRRSEEHTSELQSLAYLVCRLLF